MGLLGGDTSLSTSETINQGVGGSSAQGTFAQTLTLGVGSQLHLNQATPEAFGMVQATVSEALKQNAAVATGAASQAAKTTQTALEAAKGALSPAAVSSDIIKMLAIAGAVVAAVYFLSKK